LSFLFLAYKPNDVIESNKKNILYKVAIELMCKICHALTDCNLSHLLVEGQLLTTTATNKHLVIFHLIGDSDRNDREKGKNNFQLILNIAKKSI
jgi:hypothetical protein